MIKWVEDCFGPFHSQIKAKMKGCSNVRNEDK